MATFPEKNSERIAKSAETGLELETDGNRRLSAIRDDLRDNCGAKILSFLAEKRRLRPQLEPQKADCPTRNRQE